LTIRIPQSTIGLPGRRKRKAGVVPADDNGNLFNAKGVRYDLLDLVSDAEGFGDFPGILRFAHTVDHD
jgi:hypothetical protein